jgi:hypothetical protein
MPDLVPEERIKGEARYLRDLQLGESILVSPVAFSVTPDRFLAIPKTLSLDRLVFRLELMGESIRLGRETDGTWYADLRDINKNYQFDSISPNEMKRDRDSYLIIDKLLW